MKVGDLVYCTIYGKPHFFYYRGEFGSFYALVKSKKKILSTENYYPKSAVKFIAFSSSLF